MSPGADKIIGKLKNLPKKFGDYYETVYLCVE